MLSLDCFVVSVGILLMAGLLVLMIKITFCAAVENIIDKTLSKRMFLPRTEYNYDLDRVDNAIRALQRGK